MDSRMVVGMNIHRDICALQMNGGVVILPEQVHVCAHIKYYTYTQNLIYF